MGNKKGKTHIQGCIVKVIQVLLTNNNEHQVSSLKENKYIELGFHSHIIKYCETCSSML